MSKFKIGDRVVFHKGESYEGTGIIFSKDIERDLWNVKCGIGRFWHVEESNLEMITTSQKTYSLDLINEYLTNCGRLQICPTIFDGWLKIKHNHLESLKESVAKMQQEISALEAQLK